MPQCNPTPLEKHPPLSGAEQQPFLLHAPPHPPHTYKSGSVQPATPSNISPPSEATSQRATPCNTSGVFPPILSKRAEEKTKKKNKEAAFLQPRGEGSRGGRRCRAGRAAPRGRTVLGCGRAACRRPTRGHPGTAGSCSSGREGGRAATSVQTARALQGSVPCRRPGLVAQDSALLPRGFVPATRS